MTRTINELIQITEEQKELNERKIAETKI